MDDPKPTHENDVEVLDILKMDMYLLVEAFRGLVLGGVSFM